MELGDKEIRMKVEAINLIEKVKKAILSMGEQLGEAEGVGIFGSLARGDLGNRSDIDVFVILREKEPGIRIDKLWYNRITESLQDLDRDVTVLVYSVRGLKDISNWYVLRLASEGILLFDKGGIKGLFKQIIKAAKNAGLVEEKIGGRKVWKAKDLRFGEKLEVKVE